MAQTMTARERALLLLGWNAVVGMTREKKSLGRVRRTFQRVR